MDNKGHIPQYNITDDILNAVAMIVEKVSGMPLPEGESGSAAGAETCIHSAQFRQKGAGVFAGEHLLGRAPMPHYVPALLQELNDWLEQSPTHPLLKAGLTIYQYVMVQFYEGDNMRYGMERAERLLNAWKPQMKAVIPEDVLSQEGLIRAFEQCDLHGEAGPFLIYFLRSIHAALEAIPVEVIPVKTVMRKNLPVSEEKGDVRVQRLLDGMGAGEYTTRELMEVVGLKHRPTFRDKYLLPAMALGLVEMTIPDKPNSSQQRYRRTVGD